MPAANPTTKPPSGGAHATPPPSPNADVVMALDEIVRRAVQKRASDIHLEPKADRVRVRMRVDGQMVELPHHPPEMAGELVSRIKVLGRMDIAERRLPQDGKVTLPLDGVHVHLRASTLPCSHGEKIVLRVMRGQGLIPFERLGMTIETQDKVRELLGRTQGLLVTCGPTGSGKTSTLYSFLQQVDTSKVNVVTLEDPIEFEIPQITQSQTSAKSGYTFAAGLRAILRQDPDVIMVGEIRDAETAGIALRASLTGHLVLSTLHTSDSAETIVRLVDLGIESWVIANALTAVFAQRLVRLLCQPCRVSKRLEWPLMDGDEVGLPAGTEVWQPGGCEQCSNSGYRGRIGLFEVLVLDDEVRELVKSKATAPAIRALLRSRHVPSLRRVGIERVRLGHTSVEEVIRTT